MFSLDFVTIVATRDKQGNLKVGPKFKANYDTQDIMFRGGKFYAVWNPIENIWSTKVSTVITLIDLLIKEKTEELRKTDPYVSPLYMWDCDSGSIDKWNKYCDRQMTQDIYHTLDQKLAFVDTVLTRSDYVSKRLPYSLSHNDCPAFKELIGVLYSEEERTKIEWAVGAVVSGNMSKIQKFLVLYGAPKTGKSTILNIINGMFKDYTCTFDAKALGSKNSQFAMEPFANSPLIAIQHDGDLSRIEDNTRLNSLVAHELVVVNEKNLHTYPGKFNCMLFIGTNEPVKITNAKSGIIRRLIDVSPTGDTVPTRRYNQLMSQIEFEYGAIAQYCLDIYNEDPHAYDDYVPIKMLGASNDFYNYVMDSFDTFNFNNEVTLKVAWELYKTYCEEAKVSYPYPMRVFKEELKNYFETFKERGTNAEGYRVHNIYKHFLADKFMASTERPKEEPPPLMDFKEQPSQFDIIAADWKAQYCKPDGTPLIGWEYVRTTLKDIVTTLEHYVLPPDDKKHLIFIDFDIKDKDGNKDFKKNLDAASEWPRTYAELSKSGGGIHLYYWYTGDIGEVATLYDKDIEIKKCNGNSSIRRKLTKCTNDPIATLDSGLPLKEKKRMIQEKEIKSEKGLRQLLERCLAKEFGSTTQNINFIYEILDEMYKSGKRYDVSNMRRDIYSFACRSTHQKDRCVDIFDQMKFHSADIEEPEEGTDNVTLIEGEDDDLVFFDIEVFPNLVVLVYKRAKGPTVALINPKSAQIEEMIRQKWKLVGFNCLKYDNHIVWALLLGWDTYRIYKLSQRLINNVPNAGFWQSKGVSYTDVYDFLSEKKSLKKHEISLKIPHRELGLPWDKEVPEELWPKVVEYCENDVRATEAVFYANQGEWAARKILAEITGLTVNDTTNNLTTRFIFGTEKNPTLVYTDLATGERSDGTRDIVKFPGYEMTFDEKGKRHNMYRGEDAKFGGYVYAEPGMYSNVWVFDVASMHPTSAIMLKYFGEYTSRFEELVQARLCIKHRDFEKAKTLLGGVLTKYLDNPETTAALAQALKIAINSVYGLTSASFENPFHDKRNKNNIVALRGALFMIDLKHMVQEAGFQVVHIKTDSIKVVNPSDEIKEKIMEFGRRYGYTFEIENIYERMCLVNDAVYIAKHSMENKKDPGKWEAVGTQFAVPYVFKTLFSKEPIEFDDMCETRSTNTALYLDMVEGKPDVTAYEKELAKLKKEMKSAGNLAADKMGLNVERVDQLEKLISEGHDYQFVGKTGAFCPIKPGHGGGKLVRSQDDKYNAVSGSSDYLWLESEVVETLGLEQYINEGYYRKLVDDAVDTIKKYGDYEWFVAA